LHYTLLALAIIRAKASKQLPIPGPIASGILWFATRSVKWWSDNYRYFAAGCHDLVLAEKARAAGRLEPALVLYHKALTKFVDAKKYYWVAFTHEALATAFAARGARTAAIAHYREAAAAYRRFGAPALLARLRALMPEIAGDAETSQAVRSDKLTMTAGTGTASGAMLDLASVLKASQAISGQIDLNRLVVDMLRISMENAGADYGVLLIMAEGGGQPTERLVGRLTGAVFDAEEIPALPEPRHAPRSVVQLAIETRDVVVGSPDDERFHRDAYVQRERPRSILCQPVVTQGRTVAVLYLENRQLENAFTEGRVETLRLLASHSAIALSNAGFVRDIRASADRIGHLNSQLERILAGTREMSASASGEAAIGVALRSMAQEVPRFSRASCGVVLIERTTGDAAYWPMLVDGRFDRSSGMSAARARPWTAFTAAAGVVKANAATVVVPIKWQDETAGLLVIEGLRDADLSAEEVRFVETLSQSLGLSLKNLDYQNHLESLVAERTQALRAALVEVTVKQRKIQAIMDHIDQGILTFDGQMAVDREFSARLPGLLGETAASVGDRDLMGLVFAKSTLTTDELDRVQEVLGIVIGEEEFNWMLNASRLPRETGIRVGQDSAASERTLALDWNPMSDEAGLVVKMMLTIRDITDQRALEIKVRDAEHSQGRKMAALSQMITVDRLQVRDYLTDGRQRIADAQAEVQKPGPRFELVFRHLHTVKGASVTLNFKGLATLAHDAEEAIPGRTGGAFDRAAMIARLAALASELAFFDAVAAEVFGAGSAPSEEAWSLHSMMPRVQARLEEAAAATALPFGRLEVVDEVGAWTGEMRRALAGIVPHCVNNALDHGYLLPAKRGVSGRPLEISIGAKVAGGRVTVRISDRGVGIDHAKIKRLAAERGIDARSYLEVLFVGGASTADEVSMTSGRGVGLGAVRDIARSLGGDVRLLDRDGGGTMCEITMPLVGQALRKAS
jgi:GAF domain-containing protein